MRRIYHDGSMAGTRKKLGSHGIPHWVDDGPAICLILLERTDTEQVLKIDGLTRGIEHIALSRPAAAQQQLRASLLKIEYAHGIEAFQTGQIDRINQGIHRGEVLIKRRLQQILRGRLGTPGRFVLAISEHVADDPYALLTVERCGIARSCTDLLSQSEWHYLLRTVPVDGREHKRAYPDFLQRRVRCELEIYHASDCRKTSRMAQVPLPAGFRA